MKFVSPHLGIALGALLLTGPIPNSVAYGTNSRNSAYGASAQPLVVVDSLGVVVGRWGQGSMYMKIKGVGLAYVPVDRCTDTTTLLCYSTVGLHFSSSDCSGIPYIINGFSKSGVLSSGSYRSTDNRIYLHVASGTEGLASFQYNSYFQGGFGSGPTTCRTQSGTNGPAFPARPVIDITTLYSEPFRVQ